MEAKINKINLEMSADEARDIIQALEDTKQRIRDISTEELEMPLVLSNLRSVLEYAFTGEE